MRILLAGVLVSSFIQVRTNDNWQPITHKQEVRITNNTDKKVEVWIRSKTCTYLYRDCASYNTECSDEVAIPAHKTAVIKHVLRKSMKNTRSGEEKTIRYCEKAIVKSRFMHDSNALHGYYELPDKDTVAIIMYEEKIDATRTAPTIRIDR